MIHKIYIRDFADIGRSLFLNYAVFTIENALDQRIITSRGFSKKMTVEVDLQVENGFDFRQLKDDVKNELQRMIYNKYVNEGGWSAVTVEFLSVSSPDSVLVMVSVEG